MWKTTNAGINWTPLTDAPKKAPGAMVTSDLLEHIGQPSDNLPWAGGGRAIELLRRELEEGADWSGRGSCSNAW